MIIDKNTKNGIAIKVTARPKHATASTTLCTEAFAPSQFHLHILKMLICSSNYTPINIVYKIIRFTVFCAQKNVLR